LAAHAAYSCVLSGPYNDRQPQHLRVQLYIGFETSFKLSLTSFGRTFCNDEKVTHFRFFNAGKLTAGYREKPRCSLRKRATLAQTSYRLSGITKRLV